MCRQRCAMVVETDEVVLMIKRQSDSHRQGNVMDKEEGLAGWLGGQRTSADLQPIPQRVSCV